MKNRVMLLAWLAGILLLAYVLPALLIHIRRHSEWSSTAKALHNCSRDTLRRAVHAFAQAQQATYHVAPPTVSLQDLLAGGYVHSNDVRGLEDKDVTIAVVPDQKNTNAPWLQVHGSFGKLALLPDGTVETVLRR